MQWILFIGDLIISFFIILTLYKKASLKILKSILSISQTNFWIPTLLGWILHLSPFWSSLKSIFPKFKTQEIILITLFISSSLNPVPIMLSKHSKKLKISLIVGTVYTSFFK